MRLFSCPARYQRFVESTLALALAEVRRDISRRDDEDERIQRLATVPDDMIDPGMTGRVYLAVTVPNDVADDEALGILLGELHGATRIALEA